MSDYMYLLAIIIGIIIAIILRWKDIIEIIRMHREIKKSLESI